MSPEEEEQIQEVVDWGERAKPGGDPVHLIRGLAEERAELAEQLGALERAGVLLEEEHSAVCSWCKKDGPCATMREWLRAKEGAPS